jgi:hypothetical protein
MSCLIAVVLKKKPRTADPLYGLEYILAYRFHGQETAHLRDVLFDAIDEADVDCSGDSSLHVVDMLNWM